jgi:hypothetical protein
MLQSRMLVVVVCAARGQYLNDYGLLGLILIVGLRGMKFSCIL